MLTPQDITGQDFVRAVFGGYDMSAVDEFLEKVNTDYAALYKENAILKSKIKVLVEKVEEYRSTEDAMRMALLTAQKMGDEMMNEANKKRDELLEQAEADSRNRADELRRELADEEARLTAAKSATRRFVEEARALVRDHEDFLAQLDEISAPEPREPGEDPEQKREEEIVDTARLIDSAVNKLVEEESGPYPAPETPLPEAPAFGGEEDADFRIHTPESKWSDEDEPTSPRPKFNFDDLQFGENYTAEE